jgi:hypothetical protein
MQDSFYVPIVAEIEILLAKLSTLSEQHEFTTINKINERLAWSFSGVVVPAFT